MATDKELTLRMVDALEELIIENHALRASLKALQRRLRPWLRIPDSQLDSLIEQARSHPQAGGDVRQQFAQLRDHIRQSADLSDAIQEFLRIVPAKKDVN